MTEAQTPPTPTGGDMTDDAGIARAHLETPDEIAATPTDIEVDTDHVIHADKWFNGDIVLINEAGRRQGAHRANGFWRISGSSSTFTDEWIEARQPELSRPSSERTKGEPNAEPINTTTAYKHQHAKVLRFEFSIGKDDDDRTIEEFEKDIRDAIDLMKGTPHNVTTQGGYYIIDGKVCSVVDYDPVSKNRRPGTYPPVWAGGPKPGEKPPPTYGDDPADQPSKEASVKALAEGMNKQVKAKGGKRKGRLIDPEGDPAMATSVVDVNLPEPA